MSTTIARRVAALEQAAGDPSKRPFIVVMFTESEDAVTGLDPMLGSSLPTIDRLPGESWDDLKARASRATEHYSSAVYIARIEGAE